jgi:hypothetical protein
MQSSFEDEYLDVLQNIESAILSVYRTRPELTDYQVDSALEALSRTYTKEKSAGETGEVSPILPKSDLAREVYNAMKVTCDFRLGRVNAVDEEEQPISVKPLTIDEMVACLKRLRKSVRLWNKQSGTHGYLDYISQFLPG